jgi:hypothetical protein
MGAEGHTIDKAGDVGAALAAACDAQKQGLERCERHRASLSCGP